MTTYETATLDYVAATQAEATRVFHNAEVVSVVTDTRGSDYSGFALIIRKTSREACVIRTMLNVSDGTVSLYSGRYFSSESYRSLYFKVACDEFHALTDGAWGER